MNRTSPLFEDMTRLAVLPFLIVCIACGDAPQADEEPVEEAPPTAKEYCRSTRDLFCAYYMRCGRMNAASLDDCLEIFDESCAAVYQPRYLALEEAGKISLSEAGILACAAHLESVDCAQQIFDLDGACSGVWVGLVEAEGPCGPGLESFVCEEGTMCVVGLDLCGTCRPTVAVGEPCGADIGRCEQIATCVDGYCAARALPGQPCGPSVACVLGASCMDGWCERFEVVDVGEECGPMHRCKYNSVCMGGLCHPQAGLGEVCAWPGQCRSGYCEADAGECVPLLAPMEPCVVGSECVSGVCLEEGCSESISACFD